MITALPRFFELVGSVPAVHDQQADPTATPGFTLTDPTPTNARARFGALDETPPPTLAPPAVTATSAATPRPTATGERISIGNTGGVGAILRADPVSGQPVAALHEQQVLDVLERRTVPRQRRLGAGTNVRWRRGLGDGRGSATDRGWQSLRLMARYRLALDTGGTFTDVVAFDEDSGAVHTTKTPTTPKDPSIGFLAGVDKIARQAGFSLSSDEIVGVSHGTTVATNALLSEPGSFLAWA